MIRGTYRGYRDGGSMTISARITLGKSGKYWGVVERTVNSDGIDDYVPTRVRQRLDDKQKKDLKDALDYAEAKCREAVNTYRQRHPNTHWCEYHINASWDVEGLQSGRIDGPLLDDDDPPFLR